MRTRKDKGYALLLALFILFLVGFAAGLLALSLQLGLDEQRREVVRLRLDLLNDAVTAQTLGRLARNRDFGGVTVLEIGEGSATSTVERVEEDDDHLELRVKTVATFAGRRRWSSARVWFSDGELELGRPLLPRGEP